MKFVHALVLAAALLFIFSPCSHAQDGEDRPSATMRGSVTAIDWVGSTMTVDDTRFNVPSGVKVYKGDDIIDFSDIEIGDQVVVRYAPDQSNALRVINVTVDYSGDFPV